MVEIFIRLSTLMIGCAATWWLSPPNREFVPQAAVGLAAAYGFLHLLERRSLRTPSVNTCFGIADAAVLGWLMAQTGTLGLAGAAVALPLAITHRRNPGHLGFAAPLVAAAVPVSASFGAPLDLKIVSGHALGAVLLCVALNLPKRAQSDSVEVPDLPIPSPDLEPVPNLAVIRHLAAEHSESEELAQRPEPDVVELRENYRRLREHANDLEERARRERLAMRLLDLDAEPGDTPFSSLAGVIRDFTGARGATLYTCLLKPGALTVSASSGDVSFRARSERIVLNDFRSDVRLRAHAIAHLRDPEDDSPSAAVLLKHRGSLIGLIWLSADHEEQLNNARDRAEDAAEILARSVVHIGTAESMKQRVDHLELLYSLAGVAEGAETPRSLMMRVAKELCQTLELDHLGLSLLEEGDLRQVVAEGANLRVIEGIRTEDKTGLEAWETLRFAEIYVEDAHSDSRIPCEEAIKRRLGSAIVCAIQVDSNPYAALTAATHRKGGIAPDQAEKIRLAAAEIGLAIERLLGLVQRPYGMAVASEFQMAAAQGEGAFILLEPLRVEEITREAGPKPLETSLHEYCSRLRLALPSKAILLSRPADVLVFVPGMDLESAHRWANEAVTLAALMQIRIEGAPGTPTLVLQARASEKTPDRAKQFNEITSSVGGPA